MAIDTQGKREGSGLSRRAVLKTGAITGAAASVAVAGSVAMTGKAEAATTSAGHRTSPSEDLILRNGRIHTMDQNGTVATVIAIRGGFVAYVGDSVAAAQRQFTGQPQVIDLHGRMAVPGLIDCHNHFVLMGNRPGHHTPLENASSIADVQALYAIRAASLPTSLPTPVSADNFNAFPFFGSDLVRTGAVGEFLADISLYAGGNPVWMNAALLAAKAGWRAEVHSLTPTDFQTEIQGYEAVNEQVPITDFRWVVAHVPFITADYVARLKALGGGVNLTSYEYFEAVSPAGPPYRMLLDSGIPVGLSSDGMQIAPLNPWIHAYYATTGINALGDQVNPGQQLTRAEVLEHFTSANRWFLGGVDEDLLGTLEVGRLGDVVVLSDDYFAVSDDDLKKLHSVLTVLGGKVVHSGGIDYWA
jgi:predicted amidohydrolase YtcJ